MMKILSIACIILCLAVIIYAITIYLESRKYGMGPKKKEERLPF